MHKLSPEISDRSSRDGSGINILYLLTLPVIRQYLIWHSAAVAKGLKVTRRLSGRRVDQWWRSADLVITAASNHRRAI